MTPSSDTPQDVSGPVTIASTMDAPVGPVPFTHLTPHSRGGLGEVWVASTATLGFGL
jgi:hypothetical protein